MSSPWYLWEGAAVRTIVSGQEDGYGGNRAVGICGTPNPDKMCVEIVGEDWDIFPTPSLIPIENPAAMLAPEGATHVMIGDEVKHGGVSLTWKKQSSWDKGAFVVHYYKYRALWFQCPDHLKGTTQELPR